MGATSLGSGLSSANWAKSKPADYKGQELDNALKACETAGGKTPVIPNNLIPKVPKVSIAEITSCITDLQSALTELQKALTMLQQIKTALLAVQGAAGKASADLAKLAKGKDSDKDKEPYENAAGVANSISSAAGSALAGIK